MFTKAIDFNINWDFLRQINSFIRYVSRAKNLYDYRFFNTQISEHIQIWGRISFGVFVKAIFAIKAELTCLERWLTYLSMFYTPTARCIAASSSSLLFSLKNRIEQNFFHDLGAGRHCFNNFKTVPLTELAETSQFKS